MADELWGGQAQNVVKFDFQVKFDLEGQGRSSPKTIGTLTKVFCTFVQHLVILGWTSDELSCGQARDWHTHTRTHGHTDTQTQATTIPEGKKWPRVKSNQTWWSLAFNGYMFAAGAVLIPSSYQEYQTRNQNTYRRDDVSSLLLKSFNYANATHSSASWYAVNLGI